MKRIIIAFVLVGSAIFLAIFGYFDLKTNGKKLIKSFEVTAYTFNDEADGSVEKSLKDSLEMWKKYRTRFEIYINHDELDDIQITTKELEQYLSGKRDVEVDELCLDCINRLEHIIDAETPSLGEVF